MPLFSLSRPVCVILPPAGRCSARAKRRRDPPRDGRWAEEAAVVQHAHSSREKVAFFQVRSCAMCLLACSCVYMCVFSVSRVVLRFLYCTVLVVWGLVFALTTLGVFFMCSCSACSEERACGTVMRCCAETYALGRRCVSSRALLFQVVLSKLPAL